MAVAFLFRVSASPIRSKGKNLREITVFDVWDTVRELRQPCLTRPLPMDLIGLDGKVPGRTLAGVDRILIEHLDSELEAWSAPEEASGKPVPSDRWLLTSAMQKAIRRGDAALAMRCASRGFSLNPEHTFRRLAVCAIEDVGIGNLLVVATTLAIAGTSALRLRSGASRVATYLAYSLARSAKSRLACDLLSIVDYDTSLRPKKDSWWPESDDQLASRALNRTATWNERMLATWLLAGTYRFRGATMPTANSRSRSGLMRCMAKARMPLLIYYVADRAAARTSDAMFVSFLPIWEMLRDEPSVELRNYALPATQTINGYPAYAFDAHTREGRSALHRLPGLVPDIHASLEGRGLRQRDLALWNGLFLIEGGLQDRSVAFRTADEIALAAHFKELEIAGIEPASSQSAFLQLLEDSMPTLNELRRI